MRLSPGKFNPELIHPDIYASMMQVKPMRGARLVPLNVLAKKMQLPPDRISIALMYGGAKVPESTEMVDAVHCHNKGTMEELLSDKPGLIIRKHVLFTAFLSAGKMQKKFVICFKPSKQNKR